MPLIVGGLPLFRFALLQQTQSQLWLSVGLGQYCHAGLLQDLRFRQ